MAFVAGQKLTAAELEALRLQVLARPEQYLRYKTGDTSRPSDAIFSNDPHLQVTGLAASGVFGIRLYGLYQAGATGQLKVQWTFPSGTLEVPAFDYDPGADEFQALAAGGSSPAGTVTGLVGTGGNVPIRLEATLHMGATGGTLALQWAQTTSNATATILRKGMRLEVTRYA